MLNYFRMFRTNLPIPRQAFRESILLLERNLTPRGIVAATATPESASRNYTRVFCRDASISAMGMAVSGDPLLREGAMAGLEFLVSHQAENGQIPNFVAPESGETDFWYLGCIDATLWWLAAVGFWSRHVPEDCIEERFRVPIDAALRWLLCQEHQKIRLLQQNEASDWADIMPRSGFVLYTNALWYHVKRVYSITGAEETRSSFNALFSPFTGELPEYRRMRLLTRYVRNEGKRGDLYLSYVNFSTWGGEGDVFGNLLAVLFGLADEGRANRILDALLAAGVDAPNPVRVRLRSHPPVQPAMARLHGEAPAERGVPVPQRGRLALPRGVLGDGACVPGAWSGGRRRAFPGGPDEQCRRLGVPRVVPRQDGGTARDGGAIVERGDVHPGGTLPRTDPVRWSGGYFSSTREIRSMISRAFSCPPSPNANPRAPTPIIVTLKPDISRLSRTSSVPRRYPGAEVLIRFSLSPYPAVGGCPRGPRPPARERRDFPRPWPRGRARRRRRRRRSPPC